MHVSFFFLSVGVMHKFFFTKLCLEWFMSYDTDFCFVDDIGTNIENSHAATAQAKSQLVKAAKIQRSNSSLVIYLLLSSFVNLFMNHQILYPSINHMLSHIVWAYAKFNQDRQPSWHVLLLSGS